MSTFRHAAALWVALAAPAAAQQTAPAQPAPRPQPQPATTTAATAQPRPRQTTYQPDPAGTTAPNYHYSYYPPIPTDPSHPDYYEPAHRTVVRHSPLPSRSADDSYGYRNPGGVGRYAEYYPPGNQFQNGGRDPVRAAGFDQGIVGNRQEQMQAQALGIARNNSLQNQINTYGRPLGYGFGYGAGVGYGFPN